MDSFTASPRGPLFFMHIPKTAGMSMRTYLSEQYFLKIYPAVTWPQAVTVPSPPSSYLLVQGHFQYNMRAALRPDSKVVTVLRDPLLRTLSALDHLRRDPGFHRDHMIAKNLDLRQILRTPGLMSRQRNVQAAALCASAPFEDALLSLKNSQSPGFEVSELESPPQLSLALERASQIDFIGTTEELWLLLYQMSSNMGFHPVVDLPIINSAGNRNFSINDLREDDIEILKHYNDIDIPLYVICKDIIKRRIFQHSIQDLINRGIYHRLEGSFIISLTDPIPGSGWYAPESKHGRVWRWTGPSTEFTLELPLVNGGNTLSICALAVPASTGPRNLVASANGYPLNISLKQDGDMFESMIVVEPEILAHNKGFCRVVFNTGNVSTAVGSDLRPLGIAVNSLTVDRYD